MFLCCLLAVSAVELFALMFVLLSVDLLSLVCLSVLEFTRASLCLDVLEPHPSSKWLLQGPEGV